MADEAESTFNVSLDHYGIEADTPEEALRLFLHAYGIQPPDGTLFVVVDDETGTETEIDYRRTA